MNFTLVVAIVLLAGGILNLTRARPRYARPLGLLMLALAALNFARFFELT